MKNVLFYAVFLLLLISGCKKPDGGDDPGNGNPGTAKENLEIQINLPSGSSIDLSGGQVLSGAELSDIKNKTQAKVVAFEGDLTLAYVFDKSDNLVLMGFVGDNAKTISPATTAQVLLHWGLGLPFMDSLYTQSYLTKFDGNTIVKEWVKQFEQSFQADPLIISKGGFMDGLTTAVKELRSKGVLDVNARKSADIKVDAANVKSGIRVQEDGLSQYSVNNYYRRRAHAFLYKMNYKDMSDASHNVIDKILGSTKTDKDFAVGARSGVTSVMGEIGKWIESTDNESMVTKTGPNQLQLEDNESEALYYLRVVGTGSILGSHTRGNDLTEAELSKYMLLSTETFVLDFLIPTISLATSAKGVNEDFDWNKEDTDIAIDALKNQWKSIPDVYEEIKKGNYFNAVKKVITSIGTEGANTYLTAVFDGLGDMGMKNLLTGSVTNIKVNKVLAVFDLILGASDLAFLARDIASSNGLESFDITARTGKVTLLPEESVGVPGSFLDLEAVIKNLSLPEGTHPFFEWRTTGKYGELRDNKGHRGTSFESADAKPKFYVSASGNQLSDGDNIDYVYVTALVGGQVAGRDTAIVNVNKFAYKIRPVGITLTGKQGTSANEVVLTLLRSDNKDDISSNPEVDFKVVWETPGAYGSFRNGGESTNTFTGYNGDGRQIPYVCTDDETKEAQETIKAKVYARDKGTTGDYRLVSEDEGKINIDNDEKKKIIHIPYTVYYTEPSDIGRCSRYPTAIFPVEDLAKRYKVVFYNFPVTAIQDGRPLVTQTFTWSAGQRPPDRYTPFAATNNIHGGNYYVTCGYTGGPCDWVHGLPEPYPGTMAEITYYY